MNRITLSVQSNCRGTLGRRRGRQAVTACGSMFWSTMSYNLHAVRERAALLYVQKGRRAKVHTTNPTSSQQHTQQATAIEPASCLPPYRPAFRPEYHIRHPAATVHPAEEKARSQQGAACWQSAGNWHPRYGAANPTHLAGSIRKAAYAWGGGGGAALQGVKAGTRPMLGT